MEYSEQNIDDNPLYKVVLLGDVGVGKSTFFIKFRDNVFQDDIDDYGLDKATRVFEREHGTVNLQLWDTAGMERTGSLTDTHFRKSHAILLMYDTTERSSFNEMASRWKDNAKRYCDENVIFFVVGTKVDDRMRENITKEEVKSLSLRLLPDIPQSRYYRVSVKKNIRFEFCLNSIVDTLISEKSPSRRQDKFITLTQSNQRKKWKCCQQ